MNQIAQGKSDFDAVGHYARPDVFSLVVDETAKALAAFNTDSQVK